MSKIISTTVYTLDELSGAAHENARSWYREHALNNNWYQNVFDEFIGICNILGVDIKMHKVPVPSGGSRQHLCIWFHQFLSDGLLPIVAEEDDDSEDDYFNVHITLVNGGPVIPLSVEPDTPQNEETDDIGQLNAFFEMLDCEPETTERYMLIDEDGEDAFIRIGSIAMVRVVLDALEPVEEDEG